MISIRSKKIYLTGADCFILALEKHNSYSGGSGNTCHYVLELEGRLDAEYFKLFINRQNGLKQLAVYFVHRPSLFSIPRWEVGNPTDIEVYECANDELIPQEILSRNLAHDNTQQFAFGVVHRTNNGSALIFSWNHLLLDGQGALILLNKILSNNTDISYTTGEESGPNFLKNIRLAIKAKNFIASSSEKPLSTVGNNSFDTNIKQTIEMIEFDEEDTGRIDNNAFQAGAKFGPSSFYLACCARAVKLFLDGKNIVTNNFWIPVPQNKRRKGADTPILGNQLSFLFYRIQKDDLEQIDRCVSSVNKQLVGQLRNEMPKAYEVLLKKMKRLPSNIYYQLIKGPQGRSLSGFLFTLAENHPDGFTEVLGLRIKNAWSFPPNIFPPGLTFAFMRYRGKLKIMILSSEEVMDRKILTQLKLDLVSELLMKQEKS